MSEDRETEARRRALLAELDGYRRSALLHAAVDLGVAELLGGAPRTIAELAVAARAHEPSLARLLRGLAVIDVVSVDADGRFQLTAKGELLRCGVSGSLHSVALLAGREYMPAWAALPGAIRSGRASYDAVFGTSVWQWRERNPELGRAFDEWMVSVSAGIAGAVLAAYDMSAVETIVDVGGGAGAFLAEILKVQPRIRAILFDRAHVLEGAASRLSAAGVMSRCQLVPGDFFADVPPGGDVYVLLRILHDWDDERAGAILASCRRAMSPTAVLLVIERLLVPATIDDAATVMSDLHMLAVTGGEERSEDRLSALLDAAGLRLARVVPTASPYWILEAVPQGSPPDRAAARK